MRDAVSGRSKKNWPFVIKMYFLQILVEWVKSMCSQNTAALHGTQKTMCLTGPLMTPMKASDCSLSGGKSADILACYCAPVVQVPLSSHGRMAGRDFVSVYMCVTVLVCMCMYECVWLWVRGLSDEVAIVVLCKQFLQAWLECRVNTVNNAICFGCHQSQIWKYVCSKWIHQLHVCMQAYVKANTKKAALKLTTAITNIVKHIPFVKTSYIGLAYITY